MVFLMRGCQRDWVVFSAAWWYYCVLRIGNNVLVPHPIIYRSPKPLLFPTYVPIMHVVITTLTNAFVGAGITYEGGADGGDQCWVEHSYAACMLALKSKIRSTPVFAIIGTMSTGMVYDSCHASADPFERSLLYVG